MKKGILIAFGVLLIGFVGYRAVRIINTKLPSESKSPDRYISSGDRTIHDYLQQRCISSGHEFHLG
ncbi:MAG TPA: hypothetical protein VFW11_23090 [Cyclobacteriaceae bacterium]|nr:hypothetical protein [Cyclobacteriaceae bacterium]